MPILVRRPTMRLKVAVTLAGPMYRLARSTTGALASLAPPSGWAFGAGVAAGVLVVVGSRVSFTVGSLVGSSVVPRALLSLDLIVYDVSEKVKSTALDL